jgi:hypothetical protein
MELGEDLLNDLFVARLGRAHKIVIRAAEPGDKGLPAGGQFVAIRLGSFSFGYGSLLNFLTVLVQASQEEGFLPKASMSSRDDIGNHFLVGMAQVRLPIHIVDGGRQVKTLAHVPLLWPRQTQMARSRAEACTRQKAVFP